MKGKRSGRLTALCLTGALLAASWLPAAGESDSPAAVNQPVTEFVFDDSDAQYTGSWTLEQNDKLDQRYGDGFRYAAGWEAGNTAVYTAAVEQEGWYAVSAWWTDLHNRATDVPYAIDCGGQTVQVTVNQQEKGGRWNRLQTVYAQAGDTVTVTLGGGGNQWIVSDAMKIALIDGIIVDDSQSALTGSWSENTIDHLVDRFGSSFRFADPAGGQTPTATAAFRAVAPADGVYNVYAWWTAHENRAQDAPYTLSGGRTVRVNQEQDGGRWNLLGKLAAKAGEELSVTLGNNADQYVVADAVRFQLDDGIVDETEAVLEGPTWILETGDKAEERYGEAFYYSGWVGADSEPTATAVYKTMAAEEGWYALSAWWTAHENRSTITPYSIRWGEQTQTVRVNQQENGGMWNRLAVIRAEAGQEITVAIGNNADGYVIADAVRLEKADPPPAETYTITLQYESQGGSVAGKTAGIEKDEAVTLTAEPRPGWELDGWYLDGQKAGGEKSFTLTVGQNLTLEVRFREIRTPDGVIVDDKDAVFTGGWTEETADCVDQRYGDGFRYRVWNGAGSDPDSTAAFTITAQQTGYYAIYARWAAHPNRADDAPYTILAGGGRQTVRVNQREKGGLWNLLGGVMAQAGQEISVILGNNSDNGYVIADAVKFVRVDPAPVTYTVSVSCESKGGGVTGKTADLVQGETVTLTASPKTGWQFDGWYREGTKLSSDPAYTLRVEENLALEARFTEIVLPPAETCRITLQYESKGGSVIGKTADLVQGETVTLTASPKTGWQFDGWYREGTKLSSDPAYTLRVEENLALEARFTEIVLPTGPDKTALRADIDDAKRAKTDGRYAGTLPSIQKELDAALTAAQAVEQNPDAGQKAVTGALERLAAALEKLSVRAGDKAELSAVIAYAQGLDMAKFQRTGQDGLQSALQGARAVIADKEAQQPAADQALYALVHALAALRYAKAQ